MPFFKLELNLPRLSLAGFLFLSPLLTAIEFARSSNPADANLGQRTFVSFQSSPSENLTSHSQKLAQLMVGQCGATMEGVFGDDYVQAETTNFFAFICPIPDKKSYALVTVSKQKNSNGISTGGVILRLQKFQFNRFVAVSGSYQYILTPMSLTVSKDGKTIVNEKVLRWWHR